MGTNLEVVVGVYSTMFANLFVNEHFILVDDILIGQLWQKGLTREWPSKM